MFVSVPATACVQECGFLCTAVHVRAFVRVFVSLLVLVFLKDKTTFCVFLFHKNNGAAEAPAMSNIRQANIWGLMKEDASIFRNIRLGNSKIRNKNKTGEKCSMSLVSSSSRNQNMIFCWLLIGQIRPVFRKKRMFSTSSNGQEHKKETRKTNGVYSPKQSTLKTWILNKKKKIHLGRHFLYFKPLSLCVSK